MPQIPEDENSNKDEEGLVGFNFPKDLIVGRREFAAQASEVRINLKAAFMPGMLRNIEGLLAAAESESGRVLGRTERTLLVRRYYHHKLTEEVPEFGISSGRFSNIHAASIY